MKKKFIIVIFTMLFLNGLLVYKIKFAKNNNIVSEDIIDKVETMYQNKFIIEKENENLKLNSSTKLVNINRDTLFAKDVFKKRSIVLRYSVLNCGDCVDAETAILSAMKSDFSDKICIITYYDKIRGLIFDYKKLEKLGLNKIPIYLLIDNELGIPLEKQNVPYYFNIDSTLTMSNFFIPIKDKPRLSNSYLNSSLKNFFKER